MLLHANIRAQSTLKSLNDHSTPLPISGYPCLFFFFCKFSNGHMLTHRNKKPYECKADGCGKSYCDARSLRRHTENHHTLLSVEGSSSAIGSPPPANSSASLSAPSATEAATTTSAASKTIMVPALTTVITVPALGSPRGLSLSPATASGKC